MNILRDILGAGRAKKMKPYEPPESSEPSLEDRIERLERKYGDSRLAGPVDFLLSVFGILVIMAIGAILFAVATRAGR